MPIYQHPKILPSDTLAPVFYLIGPNGDWQIQCLKELQAHMSGQGKFLVGTPAHSTIDQEFARTCEHDGPTLEDFEEWSAVCSELAGSTAEQGCIIIWLSRGNPTSERIHSHWIDKKIPKILGDIIGGLRENPTMRFALGGENNYPMLQEIHSEFERALDEKVHCYSHITNLVSHAVRIARGIESTIAKIQKVPIHHS